MTTEPASDPEYEAWLDSLERIPDPRKEDPMKVAAMISKYLVKADVDPPKRFMVSSVKQEIMPQRDNEPEEKKWVMYFHGEERGFVLNKTNIKRAAIVFGSDDTDHWAGKTVILEYDPSVEFGGNLVGGIRVRLPRAAAPVADAADPLDDEAPF